MTKASSNSKSAFTHSHDIVTFTTEVDEKLDVARVQVEVFRAIEENEHIEQAQKDALLKALNAELFDISTVRLNRSWLVTHAHARVPAAVPRLC